MKKQITIVLIFLLTFNLLGCSKSIDPAAQLVMDEIAELVNTKDFDRADLEKAKERYNSLTDEQKKQVNNYADLLKLEDEYDKVVEKVNDLEEHKKTHYETSDFLKINEVCPNSGIDEKIEKSDSNSITVSFADKKYDEKRTVFEIYYDYLGENFEKYEYKQWCWEFTDSKGNVLTDIHTYSTGAIEFTIIFK